jgi:uncharacterized membrane protein/rubredoxin
MKNKQEEKQYICRPCGYVLKESELGDVCPACGLPRKVFDDYKERMSPGRSKFLHLDLHPIAVHFPQSMLVLSLLALIINLANPYFHPEVLLGAAQYAAVIFPFAVLAAFFSGLLDGKIRFKSVRTPVLKKKIIYGTIMLVASVFTPILALNNIDDLKTKLLLMLAGGVALICGMVLGHAGKKLMNIGLGGGMKIWGRKI